MSDIQIDVVVESGNANALIDHLLERTSNNSLRNFLASKVWPFERLRIQHRFANEGDSAVGQWQQLRLATMRIRQFQGYGPDHPINKRTGAMERHLTNSFVLDEVGAGVRLKIPGSPGNKDMQSKLRMAQGGGGGRASGGGSAGMFRAGTSGPNAIAPARPVLGLDEIDSIAMQESLLDWVMGGV